ncbi:MAG TPA: glycosyltransferase family 39 protein [Anaerolineae bacterium]|nr:glycosyltransferase family 39 protein [Anaerolineae bacterium]
MTNQPTSFLAIKRRSYPVSLHAMTFILWLAFSLRLTYVKQVSPFVDEYISMLAIESILEQGLPVLPSGFFYGPKALLHSYLGAIAVKLFGPLEFGGRYLSVVAGVLTVVLLYRIGRRWFSPNVGVLAAAALATLPSAVEWSGRVRMYGLVQLLALAGVFFLLEGSLKSNYYQGRMLGLVLLTAALFTHTVAFTVIAGLIIVIGSILLARFLKTKHLQKLWPREYLALGVLLAAVVIFNPLNNMAWGPQVQLSDLTQGSINLPDRASYLIAFTHQFVSWPLWPLSIFYGVGFVNLVLRFLKRQPLPEDAVSLSLYSLVLSIWLFTSLSVKFHHDKYLFVVIPFFLLLALREISSLFDLVLGSFQKQTAFRASGVAYSLVLPSICGAALVMPSTLHLFGQDQYGFDAAFAYVQEQWQAGDVVGTCSPASSHLLLGQADYYIIQHGAESLQQRDVWTGAPLLDKPEKFMTVLQKHPRLWFVVEEFCFERHFDPEFRRLVSNTMRLEHDQSGVLVFLSTSK